MKAAVVRGTKQAPVNPDFAEPVPSFDGNRLTVTAAAIANPGVSSLAAYMERAKLIPGETVLVNVEIGAAGRLAVQIAKHRGAKKVIAAGRNDQALRSVTIPGAGGTIPPVESDIAPENSFNEQFAEGMGIGVDHVWGKEHGVPSSCRCENGSGCHVHPPRSDWFRQWAEHNAVGYSAALCGDQTAGQRQCTSRPCAQNHQRYAGSGCDRPS